MASPLPAIHRLVHYPETHGLSESTSGMARILLESCTDRLPFGWLFLFGSRNIWEPGQTVQDRGGAAAERDPTVTPIDIAQVRLHEAAGVLRNDPALGPPSAGLRLLERALHEAGEKGQLRLHSPRGAFGETDDPADKRHRFLEHIAVAENVVYHLAQKKGDQVQRGLEALRTVCAFVPSGEPGLDGKELQKALKFIVPQFPLAEGLVRLTVGWPPGGRIQTLFAADAPGLNTAFQDQVAAAPAPADKPWWAFWK